MARGEQDRKSASRRGGGSGREGEGSREIQISKKLSWLLRHGAEKEGLKLGSGGYANVKDVLDNRTIRNTKISLDDLKAIAAADNKQRYSLIHVSEAPGSSTDVDDVATTTEHDKADMDDPSLWLIRANQGHSIKVAEDGLLEPISRELDNVPTTVVHGTTMRAWSLIASSGGLKPMTRTHVHFAAGLPAGFSQSDAQGDDQPVISGMRNSSSILIYLDAGKALDAGLKLWRSANGVILCSGDDEQRLIPLGVLQRVEERKAGGGRILLSDGVLANEKK